MRRFVQAVHIKSAGIISPGRDLCESNIDLLAQRMSAKSDYKDDAATVYRGLLSELKHRRGCGSGPKIVFLYSFLSLGIW